ncbi:class I SAM-dependent methyltransferase [uncultured Desulfovibrio sp.]|uniref:class I SAM-dependent methyltransferase n=1 Tax=uncultured Desulfovibrio sp. TaxID=167968 RepID=UPI0025D96D04|nr:class I SAM-dependent methyltransferase [uncultured Desulfovibrio sp.]
MNWKNMQKTLARWRMRMRLFRQDMHFWLPLARQKGWRWTWRHARLCRNVYLPWLKTKLSCPGGFDRDFYIDTYVRGPVLVDPLEHYLRRGMYYGLKPNATFDPLRYRLSSMRLGDRRSPLLHQVIAREKGHAGLPYPIAACQPSIARYRGRVNNCFEACARSGFRFARAPRFLDFGCGDGHMVAALRAHGIDAWGYDLVSRISPDYAAYNDFFRDGTLYIDNTGEHAGISNYQLKSEKWRLPFPDQSFDVVFSQQTLEHVFDLDLAFAEMTRILKPGGIALHIYPPKNCFMERHVHVPLGHRLHFKPYYYLYFLLARTTKIPGETARERALHAWNFVDTATCYTSNSEMRTLTAKHFSEVHLDQYRGISTFRPLLTLYHRLFPHTMLLACRK